jgi:hypothetical protein
MKKFVEFNLLKEGARICLNTDHIFSVIDKKDYSIIVMDLYDSPNKRKTYKVRDTYHNITLKLMMD